MIPGWLHCAWLIVQCQTRLLWARCVLSAPCNVFAAYSAFWWHRAPCKTASLWVRAPLQPVWLLCDFLPHLLAPEQQQQALLSTGSCQGHKNTEQHISSACKENMWRLLPNPRKAAHPASGRAKVSPGRSPAASSQGSVSPKSLSALRLTGSPCLTETSKVIITKKKGGQQFLSC